MFCRTYGRMPSEGEQQGARLVNPSEFGYEIYGTISNTSLLWTWNLGLIIDCDLCFKKHISSLISKTYLSLKLIYAGRLWKGCFWADCHVVGFPFLTFQEPCCSLLQNVLWTDDGSAGSVFIAGVVINGACRSGSCISRIIRFQVPGRFRPPSRLRLSFWISTASQYSIDQNRFSLTRTLVLSSWIEYVLFPLYVLLQLITPTVSSWGGSCVPLGVCWCVFRFGLCRLCRRHTGCCIRLVPEVRCCYSLSSGMLKQSFWSDRKR